MNKLKSDSTFPNRILEKFSCPASIWVQFHNNMF